MIQIKNRIRRLTGNGLNNGRTHSDGQRALNKLLSYQQGQEATNYSLSFYIFYILYNFFDTGRASRQLIYEMTNNEMTNKDE